MSSLHFDRSHRASYGVLETVAPQLRRITANNPSPFTFLGTETYVIGEGEVAVVDPGPNDPKHIEALLSALKTETITHILLTHTHADHSSGCTLLQEAVSAPLIGYQLEAGLSSDVAEPSPEGADLAFSMDEAAQHGDSIYGRDWSVECVYTPGHMLNHLCFSIAGESTLLSGDHVMGWSTSIVSPPEGHMGSYLQSLESLLARNEQTYWPGHGGPVRNAQTHVTSLLEHRRYREKVVVSCLREGVGSIAEMTPVVYADIDQALYPAAARSLYATLIYLAEQGRIEFEEPNSIHSAFRLL